ncbi:attachment protein [Pseudomonas aeruginosa]|nr:attachment protein [Pseudomonas aeruginosa]KAB0704559.1 attachment protein [Pseudomonas aeruginosa]
MRIKRTLLVLLTLFMSVCASAEDYYWPRGTQKYGSYMEVVEEARKAAIANNPGYSRVEAVRVIYPANGRQDMATYGLEFYCLSQGVERMCSTSYNNPVYRKGEGCTAPKIPDETTGTCKEPPTPPEDCIKGLTDLFSSPPSNIFVSGGRNFVNSSPPTGCKNGCQYLPTTSKTTSCYRYPGSDNQGFCNYVLMTDGSACAADSGNPGMTGPSLNDTPPTNPDEPPSDPNDPGCPPGYSWSGTTCVKTPTDPTEPGGDGGDGGNCDPAKQDCSPGPAGPGGELKEPKPGTWDDAIATWEQKVEQAKKELKDKVRANVDQMKGAFDLNLAEGGGQLPCESMTIWGRSYSLCVADYADQLSNLRVALLLMAALIAAFILLRD